MSLIIAPNKPVIVCGPTGSGKTDLAIWLAIKYGGELVNADSRQIYKGLNIGTNKGVLVEQGDHYAFNSRGKLVPIHLVSFIEPDQPYNAWQFAKDAESKITQILARKKLPIIIGGSGLYLQALISGINAKPQSNERDELIVLSIDELKKQIPAKELAKLNTSDTQNRRRLVRLIEKLKDTDPGERVGGTLSFQVIYIKATIAELEAKLKQRVKQMWAEGLLEEYRNIKSNYGEHAISLQGIGYREVAAHIEKQLDENETIERIYLAHRQYAKRQLTWFQKYLQTKYLGSSTLQQLSLSQLRSLLK